MVEHAADRRAARPAALLLRAFVKFLGLRNRFARAEARSDGTG